MAPPADRRAMAPEIRVGFVGLGQAGWAMASNLLAGGYRVAAFDLDADRRRGFAAAVADARVVDSLAGLADSEVLVTMLPNGEVVREVLLGDAGLAGRLAPGTIVLDTSSSDPYRTRELGDELAGHGLVLLDAPVTRPEHDYVNTRRITFMVAGDDEAAIDTVLPLLETMAERVFRVGGLGSGHALKTLNNYVAAAGLIAAMDALVAGHGWGLDAETMLEVFNAGTARNFSTESVLHQQSLTRNYGTGFQLALLVKDLGIAAGVTDRLGADATMPALVRDRLAAALESLEDPRADHSAAIEHWERQAEVELPPAQRPPAESR